MASKQFKLLAGILFFATGALVGFLFASSISVVSFEGLTQYKMLALGNKIKSAAKATGTMPVSLENLLALGAIEREDMLDAWNNKLSMNVVDENTFILSSQGNPGIRMIDSGISYCIKCRFSLIEESAGSR